MKNLKSASVFFLLLFNIYTQGTVIPNPAEVKSASDSVIVLAPGDVQHQEELLLLPLLSRYHYKKINLNDSLSAVIFDNYLKSVDLYRLYFLASDIENFNKSKYQLDNDLKIGRLKPAYDIFNLYLRRLKERQQQIHELLKTEFDFSSEENYMPDRKNENWAKDKSELDEIWRKRIKNEALVEKLNGKDWTKISEILEKRYRNFERRMTQYKPEEVFQLFVNQFSESVDPHTQYFSPITSDNFKMNMSLSLEGIGASLQSEDEYTKVTEIIAGGPAFKSKLLKANDKIISVAQGENGEMVDVIGKNLDDVVKLIRGPKGTTVRLQIIQADAGVNSKPKEIKIVRDKVKLEDKAAKKEVINIDNEGSPFKVGVITLPEFYLDFDAQSRGEKDYRSTARDVKRLIKELKNEKVEGIVLDLRNNGGGSLQEAVDMTGLFIKEGPVVQVRDSDGSIDVGRDSDPDISYDGPLAVLVNKFSASASEIFAAAIQDYKRGVIVGEQTYGKGTVQNLIDLNHFSKSNGEKLGQLKITIAKFYRINGGSTQRLGVMPELKFPSPVDTTYFGESSEPSALAWDQIPPGDYTIFNKIGNAIPKLIVRHEQRMKTNPLLISYTDEVKEYIDAREKKEVSLNETKRKKERDEEEEKKFNRLNERRHLQGLKLINKGEVEPKDEKSDPVLKETANIVADLFTFTSGRTTAK
ncbi:MAG: carboxy terminal-processing peptidase [Ignavibacteria bacterium]